LHKIIGDLSFLISDMDHQDHIALLKDGLATEDGIWADFGAGTGAFTLALAELLGPSGQIYSIDKDRQALDSQARTFNKHFADLPHPSIQYINYDYTQKLDLPLLDGALMANSLHFHKQKESVIQLLQGYLRPEGAFILVEYNVDRGNHWVPYPLSFPTWERLSQRLGFGSTKLLARHPSSFLNEFYSALSVY
jgi:SAM-dependent methyltransferase